MSRADIDALNAAFVQGVEERDAAKIAACYAPDAQLIAPGSSPLTGAAIEAFWATLLEAGVEGGALKTSSLEEAGDRAIEVGQYELRAGGELADTGNYVVVHRRQPDGSWKLGIDIFNSDRETPKA